MRASEPLGSGKNVPPGAGDASTAAAEATGMRAYGEDVSSASFRKRFTACCGGGTIGRRDPFFRAAGTLYGVPYLPARDRDALGGSGSTMTTTSCPDSTLETGRAP
jgi:hypothetical protein